MEINGILKLKTKIRNSTAEISIIPEFRNSFTDTKRYFMVKSFVVIPTTINCTV